MKKDNQHADHAESGQEISNHERLVMFEDFTQDRMRGEEKNSPTRARGTDVKNVFADQSKRR